MGADRDSALVLDILGAARQVLTFIEGMDHAAFQRDPKTQSAVIFQLVIIGEATKRLSDGFRSSHPSVPWSDIARMRDRMIHHYTKTNTAQVWKTVERDVPALLRALEPAPRADR